MNLGTAAAYSVLGIGVVFCALTMLLVIISILYKVTSKDGTTPGAAAPASTVAPAADAAPAPQPVLASGTAGDVKLYNAEPKDAAMVMAIVADRIGKPLNELRFISVKRIDEDE